MTPAFDTLVAMLKRLPGVGYRSAERMALHLILERPEELPVLMAALENARTDIHACHKCGNLAQEDFCEICQNPRRNARLVCVVERVPDLVALERSAAFNGLYHVLGGRLSPMNGIGPDKLNMASLRARIVADGVEEVVLALSNDIEGEATCHYLQQEVFGSEPLKVTRIAFGIPSGASLTYSDQVTLKSALDGRRALETAGV